MGAADGSPRKWTLCCVMGHVWFLCFDTAQHVRLPQAEQQMTTSSRLKACYAGRIFHQPGGSVCPWTSPHVLFLDRSKANSAESRGTEKPRRIVQYVTAQRYLKVMLLLSQVKTFTPASAMMLSSMLTSVVSKKTIATSVIFQL